MSTPPTPSLATNDSLGTTDRENAPRYPSVRGVNIVLVITLFLVASVGAFAQSRSLIWGSMFTELVLVLAPTLLYLWIARLPLRTTLRLSVPSGRMVAQSLLLGVGMVLLTSWWSALVSWLLGYSLPLTPDLYPSSLGQALLLSVSIILLAPLCEEILFRGVVQRAYEQRFGSRAVVIVAVLFAMYHLSLLRLGALLPIALILCAAVRRSQCLPAGMLIHASYNAVATLPSFIDGLYPSSHLEQALLTPGAGLAGLLLAWGAWLLFRQTTAPADRLLPRRHAKLFSQLWPLLLILPIFGLYAGSEVLVGRAPELLARNEIELATPPWTQATTWRYELRNIVGEDVGRAECSIIPEAESVLATTTIEQRAFEARDASSYFNLDALSLQQTAHWSLDDLHLLDAEGELRSGSQTWSWTTTTEGSQPELRVFAPGQPEATLPIASDTLLAGEWPWRLSTLPWSAVNAWQAELAAARRLGETVEASRPGVDAVVVIVYGVEQVTTPAGRFLAWYVKVGHMAAWYDVNAPHTLVKLDDGTVTFLLLPPEDQDASATP